MGQWVQISAEDGHSLSVYVATASGSSAPAVVLLQEIFGVTTELKALADRFAANGFCVAVPALYDRIEPQYEVSYDDADRARAAKNQLRYDELGIDIRAAIDLVDTGNGVALLGYCWGGGLAYWMAQNYSVDAVVSYYGTSLAQYCKSSGSPAARCQFHFGLDDAMIDAAARKAVRDSCRVTDEYFEYEGAGHAFANVARPAYRKQPAELAERRTLDFLRQTLNREIT